MKRSIAILASFAFLLAACGESATETTAGSTEGGAAAQEPLAIYVVVHGGSGDPYWQIVRKGVEDAGAKLGDEITWLAPEEFSLERLVELMNSAVAAQPDGIIAPITDAAAVDPPLRDAISQGIPLIAFDVPDVRPPEERIPYLFYVGGDEFLAGRLAAERMLAEGGITGALCAVHEVGNLALELRCQGFAEAMDEAGVATENLDVGTDPGRVQGAVQSFLSANPDTNAILTLGPAGAIPTIQYLDDNDLWGTVSHGTFDLNPTTNASINAGNTLFAIDTQPYLMGYLAVTMMDMHVRYQFNLPSDIPTGPAFIDASNIAEVEELSEQQYR